MCDIIMIHIPGNNISWHRQSYWKDRQKVNYGNSKKTFSKQQSLGHLHTVAIWTFTFHKKSGYLVVDLEGKFQTSLEAKLINFLN
jgi:hypothetical protein